MTATVAAVRTRALDLGFLAAGVASLEPSRRTEAFDRWLTRGYAGTMRYLHRQAAKRNRPAEIVPGAAVAVMVLDNYLPRPVPNEHSRIRVAKYARGRDYHLDMKARLDQLATFLIAQGATVARSYVDAGPVPERELAERAGLGWIGKNTMLIRPGVGSFFFIGAVLTDLRLAPDRPLDLDHCGSCTRCLEACPTGALVAPRVLDATRCISYLTIEHRGPVPEPLVEQLGGWAFGCDVCNDVCPWNERFAESTTTAGYQDRAAVTGDPGQFAEMTPDAFATQFGDTPLERPGLAGMRRNLANALTSLS